MAARISFCLTFTIFLACGSPTGAAGGTSANRPAQPRRSAARPTAPRASTPKTATSRTATNTTPAAKSAARQPLPPKAPVKPALNESASAVDDAPQAGTKSYKLRYKFTPGQTLRWEVEHRAKVRTTVSGSTQTAETLSTSIKVWKVGPVDDLGNATFVYSVERVEMTQKFDGRQETRYNSQTDAAPPPGYDKVAAAVDKPLAEITLDPLGVVLKREERYVQAAPMQENITLPLPEQPVAVGEEWKTPADIMVTLPEGITRKIKARQVYRLEAVDDGVAAIRLETQVLTPVNDPAIESQLVQSKANGTVRFDIAAGRIVSQQSDIDEHVSGFQGPASNLHYVTRFTEKLLPTADRAALHPQQGPQRK